MMKTLRLIEMALLVIVMSVSFNACSNDDDENKEASTSLVGTTWKVTSVDNAGGYFNHWTNATGTFNKNGTLTINPKTGWNYTRWTLNDKTLKIVVGENAADDYIEGTISINGKSAEWDCYWADVDGKWTNKDKPHAIVHLQKQ